MTVKDQRKDITISSSYSFFKHLEYLYPLKIESKPPLPPYPTLLVQLSIRAEVGLILYPDFSVFYVRRPEHDIMFGLNNLISEIVQAHSRVVIRAGEKRRDESFQAQAKEPFFRSCLKTFSSRLFSRSD